MHGEEGKAENGEVQEELKRDQFMADFTMNDSPNQLSPFQRSHFVRPLIFHKSRTFVSVWDLQFSQWIADCLGNSSLFIPLLQTKNILQITECSSPATLEIVLFFRTWSFTWLTNDLDSTDNSNSVSSFPMMTFWSLATSWEVILSGRPDLSRCVSPYLTDCAVPSRRISSWSSRTFRTVVHEVLTSRLDRSYVEASTLEKTKHGRNLLKRSSPWMNSSW